MTGDSNPHQPALTKHRACFGQIMEGFADGLDYTLKLRRGLRFSDGQAVSSGDVLFLASGCTYEKVNSPQRDLLIV